MYSVVLSPLGIFSAFKSWGWGWGGGGSGDEEL